MMARKYYILIAILVVIIMQVLVLRWLGNFWICPCGSLKFWEGAVKTPENSQHLFDWYTFSHIIYGFVLYFLLWLANRKLRWSIGVLVLMVVLISVGWELFENTKFVVQHYQSQVISSEYYGDSVTNSVLDTASVVTGFLLAYVLPSWVVVAIAIVLEVLMAVNIRDSVVLNIVMFVAPLPSLIQWQAALSP